MNDAIIVVPQLLVYDHRYFILRMTSDDEWFGRMYCSRKYGECVATTAYDADDR
jgi:hypothetical protein